MLWRTADADIRAHVETAVAAVAARAELVGAYLHGSLAMGCYRRAHSDIDLLFVVGEALSAEARRAMALEFVALSDTRPTLGDIEMSVVLARDAAAFTHPMPFEVHVSSDWIEAIRGGEMDFAESRRDPDLAAHVTVTRARGIALVGPPPETMFEAPAWSDYVASVESDFDWIVDEGGVHESPVYGVLNLCRTLQLRAGGEGTVASKEEGGVWGLENLPEAHRPIVAQALALYRSEAPFDPAQRRTRGVAWDRDALEALRQWVKEQPRWNPLP